MRRRHVRYFKTLGSLIMVLAFVSQWGSDEFLKGPAEAAFSPSSAGVGEIRVMNNEILYHLTKDASYLKEALEAQAMTSMWFIDSPAFRADTKEARAAAVLEVMQAKPTTFGEYLSVKDKFNRTMGKYWHDEWIDGATRLQHRLVVSRYVLFALSLVGLIMIWVGERTPETPA